jgi:hypothetical protein
MFRAREGTHPLWPRVLAGLGLALSSLEFGCSTMTGLHSVGTDRPGVLGFWDRSQPAPDPAADYYARYMHAAKSRADASAKRSAGIGLDQGQPPRDEPNEEQLASLAPEETSSRPRTKSDPVRDEALRVTLGRPEPLPALAGGGDTEMAWTASTTRRQGDPLLRTSEADNAPHPGRRPAEERLTSSNAPKPRTAPAPQRPARRTAPEGKEILAQSAATMKIPVDSPLIMKNSRHSIAEAGLDTIIENLRKSQDDSRKTNLGRLDYHGIQKPPGLDRPSHVFSRRSPAGETWTVFLDAKTMLPCMAVAKDHSGDLDERYVYHDVRENPTELTSADAFDPSHRWGESNGLLSRFARAAMGSDGESNRQTTAR